MTERRVWAIEAHAVLSVRQRCQLLQVNRSSLYYQPTPIDPGDVTLMNELQEVYSEYPFMGYRRLSIMLQQRGYAVNRKHVYRLMKVLGVQAVYPGRNLSKRRREDQVYPYLLHDSPPQKPNDVWQVDITYIKLSIGFVYLVALIDVISRRIMGWSLSPYLETASCLEALHMATKQTRPTIINSDQGCQFTSKAWVQQCTDLNILISMDAKGRYLDNIMIERFWRSIKYEEVYLKDYESVQDARKQIGQYMEFYNAQRPHQSLQYQTPDQVYQQHLSQNNSTNRKNQTPKSSSQIAA